MSSRPFSDYRITLLWSALDDPLNELIATRELTVNTVISDLCRQLIAKKVVALIGPNAYAAPSAGTGVPQAKPSRVVA